MLFPSIWDNSRGEFHLTTHGCGSPSISRLCRSLWSTICTSAADCTPMMAIGLLVHLARLYAEPFANSELWLSDELLSARSDSPSPLRLASAMGRKVGASLGRKQTLRREPRKHRTSTGLISTAVIRLAAGMVESEH